MHTRSLPLLAVLALAATGCTTAIDTGLPAADAPPRRMWVMGYASGLVMPGLIHVSRACPAGVSRVRTEQTAGNFAVQTLTAGVLSPRTVTVTCARSDGAVEPVMRGAPWWRDGHFDREFERRGHRSGHPRHFHRHR